MIANSEADLLPPDTVIEEVGTGGRDAALVITGCYNRLSHTCSLLLLALNLCLIFCVFGYVKGKVYAEKGEVSLLFPTPLLGVSVQVQDYSSSPTLEM